MPYTDAHLITRLKDGSQLVNIGPGTAVESNKVSVSNALPVRLSARTAEPLGVLVCQPSHRHISCTWSFSRHRLIWFGGVKVAVLHRVVVPVQLQCLERDLVVANVMCSDGDCIQLGIEVDSAIGDIEATASLMSECGVAGEMVLGAGSLPLCSGIHYELICPFFGYWIYRISYVSLVMRRV